MIRGKCNLEVRDCPKVIRGDGVNKGDKVFYILFFVKGE